MVLVGWEMAQWIRHCRAHMRTRVLINSTHTKYWSLGPTESSVLKEGKKMIEEDAQHQS